MADIWQPKPSKGLMGSKAFGIGMGIATGNPMMAAGALAGEDSPAGKMLSMYNRFDTLSKLGAKTPKAPTPYADSLEMPDIGDSIYNPKPPAAVSSDTMQMPTFGGSNARAAMGRRFSLGVR